MQDLRSSVFQGKHVFKVRILCNEFKLWHDKTVIWSQRLYVLENYVNLRRHVVQPRQITLTKICITYTAFGYQAQYWYTKVSLK